MLKEDNGYNKTMAVQFLILYCEKLHREHRN